MFSQYVLSYVCGFMLHVLIGVHNANSSMMRMQKLLTWMKVIQQRKKLLTHLQIRVKKKLMI